MDIEFNSTELIQRFENSEHKLRKLSQCAEVVILSDGTLAQIQISLTTYESEFLKEGDALKGYV